MQDEPNTPANSTIAQEENHRTWRYIQISQPRTHEAPGVNAKDTSCPTPDDDDYCSLGFLKEVDHIEAMKIEKKQRKE